MERSEKRKQRIRSVLSRQQYDAVVFLDSIRNPHNIAAIMRTCDAAGIQRLLYTSNGGVFSFSREISSGSEKWVDVEKVEEPAEVIKWFKKNGYRIYTTALLDESVDYRSVDWTEPFVLVMGNEVSGVSKEILELSDRIVKIPMYGTVQSLNVSVACGVVLYEVVRQREEKGMYQEKNFPEEIYKRWLRL